MSGKIMALHAAVSVAALVTGSQTAWAQQVTVAPSKLNPDEAASPEQPSSGSATGEKSASPAVAVPSSDIVVTGSRIMRSGYSAPTPVSVVTTDDLVRKAPSNIADGLNQLPIFQNSINANQQQFTQSGRQRTGNYLNLRALGTQRVLVLQDGQRLPPSGTNGGIDASLIPQLLTERVDVVTGGASAAYGSDAVSGVVNYVLNKKLTGLRAQLQRGISSRGYAGSYRAGLAGGFGLFDDRVHVILSAERYHSDVVSKESIPSALASYQTTGAGTAASPFRIIDGVLFGTSSNGGYIQNGPLAGKQFASDGSVVPFDAGIPSGTAGLQRFGDGGSFERGSITPSQTANQLFGRVAFDINDDFSMFASLGYNAASSSDSPVTFFRFNGTIFRENPYLTPATLAALGSTASFTIGRIANEIPYNVTTQSSSSIIANAGLSGKIGTFKFNLTYTHGETLFRVSARDIVNQRFYASNDPVRDSSGKIVCRVDITNPGLYPGCVPLNLMGVGNVSQAAYDYITDFSRARARNVLDGGQLSFSGDLFDIWGGPVSVAFGGEVRRQSLNQTSNADPAVAISYTGLRGVQASNTLRFQQVNVGVASGSYTIKEAFGEIDLPVLKDSAVGTLNLNGAVRYTDYSTSGGVTTWKAGAVYDPIPGVRFRTTLSRDIRAPSLFELYAGQSAVTLSFSDRLTGQTGIARQLSGGNPNLRPEVAKSFTGGVVLSPSFLPRFSFSADYFKIKINDAIATPFAALTIIDLCAASNYTSSLCALITRPLGPTDSSPANFPLSVSTLNENISSLNISGIDFEASYNFPLLGGTLGMRALATRQIKFSQQDGPGQPVREFAGTADFSDAQFPVALPKWRGNFDVNYIIGNLTLGVQERVIGSYERSKALVYEDSHIGAVWYTDANVTFKVPSRPNFEMFFTVNNLFDRQPPLIPVTRTPRLTVPTIRSAYDILGRYLTAGVRLKL